MLRQGNPPVNLSLEDVLSSVKRAQIVAILNQKELLEISRVLYVSRRMKTYLTETGEGVNNPGFQNWNLLSLNMFEWLKSL